MSWFCKGSVFFEKTTLPLRPLENIVVSVCAQAPPTLLIFSLFARPFSAIGGGCAQSPLQKSF